MRALPHLVVLLASLPAAATPFGVRLTLAGDPARSMAISWNSDDPTDREVHFGTSPAAFDSTFIVGDADVHAMGDVLGTSFSARLVNLAPGTIYFYKVGKAGALHPSGEP